MTKCRQMLPYERTTNRFVRCLRLCSLCVIILLSGGCVVLLSPLSAICVSPRAVAAKTGMVLPQLEDLAWIFPDWRTGVNPHREERTQSRRCPIPEFERTLNSIIEGLFYEGNFPRGDILDVGANDGETSEFLACVSGRVVRAIEPLPAHVRHIRNHAQRRAPNVHPYLYALADKTALIGADPQDVGMVHLPAKLNQNGSSSRQGMVVPVRRLDDLHDEWALAEGREAHLAFAHVDVEGSELELFLGSTQVLSRDRPLLTIEVAIHSHAYRTSSVEKNRKMLRLLERNAYALYVVEEPCGVSMDMRNLLGIPRERLTSLIGSPTLDLAVRAGRLLAVNSANLTRFGYADCCREGGVCNRKSHQLCNVRMVRKWLRSQAWTSRNGTFPAHHDTTLLWQDTMRFPLTF